MDWPVFYCFVFGFSGEENQIIRELMESPWAVTEKSLKRGVRVVSFDPFIGRGSSSDTIYPSHSMVIVVFIQPLWSRMQTVLLCNYH